MYTSKIPKIAELQKKMRSWKPVKPVYQMSMQELTFKESEIEAWLKKNDDHSHFQKVLNRLEEICDEIKRRI